MIIPITKVTAAIKALRPVLAILDAAPSGRAIRQTLRNKGLDLPEHLGGSRSSDVTPDTIPDAHKNKPDTVVSDADRPRSETDIDNEAEHTLPPEEPETPEADNNTTNVPEDNRTDRMRVGDLAEDDARLRLNNAGYDTYSIKNSSGHGTDIIAIDRETGNIRVIEVKARTSDLSGVQRDGGYDHSNDVLRRFNEDGNSTWTDEGFLQQLRGLAMIVMVGNLFHGIAMRFRSIKMPTLRLAMPEHPSARIGLRGRPVDSRMVNLGYGFKLMLIQANYCVTVLAPMHSHRRKTDA